MKWPKVLYAHDDSEIPVVKWLKTGHNGEKWEGVGYRGIVVRIGKKEVTSYAHTLVGRMRFKRSKAK